MAIQTSLYTFRNKLGNVRGIKFGGLPDYYVGLLGGATKEQILTEPNFARTRENMSEFGGASEASRIFRVGVAYLSSYMESYFSGYLNSITLRVLQAGPGPRGQREILYSTNQTQVEQTQLNRALTFGSVFQAPYTTSTNIARNQQTTFIAAFDPSLLINAPVGATHFQIVINPVAMSDWEFVLPEGYRPKNATASGVNMVAVSAFLALNAVTPNTTVVAALPASPTMTNSTLFTTIGIQFYQFLNAVYYPLFEGNSAKIDLLF